MADPQCEASFYSCVGGGIAAPVLRERAAKEVGAYLQRSGWNQVFEDPHEASYELRVRVVDYNGCEPPLPKPSELEDPEYYRSATYRANRDRIQRHLRSEYASATLGWARLDFELFARSDDAPIFQGTYHGRVPKQAASPEDAADAALLEAVEGVRERAATAIGRHLEGASPYGNLGAACIPFKDEPPAAHCPSALAVVHLQQPYESVPEVEAIAHGLPVTIRVDAMVLEQTAMDTMTVVGVFADSDEALRWIRARNLVDRVQIAPSIR